MRRPTASATTSGGSAMCESFSRIIQTGNFATACAKFWRKFTPRLQDDPLQRFNASTRPNILRLRLLSRSLCDRRLRRHEALPRRGRRKRDRAPASRREGGQQYEKSDWNRAKHPEKAHKFVSFIDVS